MSTEENSKPHWTDVTRTINMLRVEFQATRNEAMQEFILSVIEELLNVVNSQWSQTVDPVMLMEEVNKRVKEKYSTGGNVSAVSNLLQTATTSSSDGMGVSAPHTATSSSAAGGVFRPKTATSNLGEAFKFLDKFGTKTTPKPRRPRRKRFQPTLPTVYENPVRKSQLGQLHKKTTTIGFNTPTASTSSGSKSCSVVAKPVKAKPSKEEWSDDEDDDIFPLKKYKTSKTCLATPSTQASTSSGSKSCPVVAKPVKAKPSKEELSDDEDDEDIFSLTKYKTSKK